MAVALAMLATSALSREVALSMAEESALLLVAMVVLVANGAEIGSGMREEKGAVHHPHPHSSVTPPHISILLPSWCT
jgi:hypothetical protein